MLLPLVLLLLPLLLPAAGVRRAIFTGGCSWTSLGTSARSCSTKWRQGMVFSQLFENV
jgi:hypothetical protein